METFPRPECPCATQMKEVFDASVGNVVQEVIDNFYAAMARHSLCSASSPFVLELVVFNLAQNIAISLQAQRNGVFKIVDFPKTILESKSMLEEVIKDLPERLLVHYEKSLAAAELAKQGLSS